MTFHLMCKGKYIASSPFFDVKSPTGILTATTCHVDLFQFMKTSFFILIRLVGRSSPEILPKNGRGEPGFSLNTIVVESTSTTIKGAEGYGSLLHLQPVQVSVMLR